MNQVTPETTIGELCSYEEYKPLIYPSTSTDLFCDAAEEAKRNGQEVDGWPEQAAGFWQQMIIRKAEAGR